MFSPVFCATGSRCRPLAGSRGIARARAAKLSLLRHGQFGLLSTQAAFGFGDLHSLSRACPDQVRFEFGDHGQDVEE